MPLFHTSTVGQIDDTSTTGTITSVASTTTSAVILAANPDRKGATFQNRSTSPLFLAFGATASAVAFTVKLETDDYYELPFNYTGVISGIWTAANGAVVVTQLT